MSGLASHMCLLRANFARCAGYLQTNTEKSEQIRTLDSDNLDGNESEPVRFLDATVIIPRAAIIWKHSAGALGSEASLLPRTSMDVVQRPPTNEKRGATCAVLRPKVCWKKVQTPPISLTRTESPKQLGFRLGESEVLGMHVIDGFMNVFSTYG